MTDEILCGHDVARDPKENGNYGLMFMNSLNVQSVRKQLIQIQLDCRSGLL